MVDFLLSILPHQTFLNDVGSYTCLPIFIELSENATKNASLRRNHQKFYATHLLNSIVENLLSVLLSQGLRWYSPSLKSG